MPLFSCPPTIPIADHSPTNPPSDRLLTANTPARPPKPFRPPITHPPALHPPPDLNKKNTTPHKQTTSWVGGRADQSALVSSSTKKCNQVTLTTWH